MQFNYRDMDFIMERLRANEIIARKFHQVEIKILSILNFRDFFEVLLTEIREQFKVPYVWITLIDKSEISDMVQSLERSQILKNRMSVIGRQPFFSLLDRRGKPLLVNDDLRPYFKLLPNNRKYFIKSMAIAPISLDGAIIGSLNQADFDQQRFAPHIDPTLLEQLAVKVSLCLSNVTAHEKLRYMAYRDPLTGLLNRRVMESVLKREFTRAKRYGNALSVVFLDLDDFKGVNDRYGHDCGDELLKHLATGLKQVSRDSDVVARFAGDEFVLILPETPPDKAQVVMKRVQRHFDAQPLSYQAGTIPVSVSFGIASTVDDAYDSAEQLLKEADARLYTHKQSRKQKKQPPIPAARPAALDELEQLNLPKFSMSA